MFDEDDDEEEGRRLSLASMMSEKLTPQQPERKDSQNSMQPKGGGGAQNSMQPKGGGGAPPSTREIRDPSRQCRCKKSKCIRQYCVCFR